MHVLWWILVGLAVLIVLLCLTRVGAQVVLKDGSATVDVKVSVFRIRVYPKKEKPEKEKKTKGSEKTPKPNYYKEVEIALTESLGRKISVTKTKSGKGGALTIEFYSDDELKSFANLLGRFS